MFSNFVTFAAVTCNAGGFFGLKPWYAYLDYGVDPVTGQCGVLNFNLLPGGGNASDVPLILLAIVDDLIRVVGLISVAFVIYGGIQYATSQGTPEATSKAQSTIINALIGLALSVVAVAIIAFLANTLV
ncbi:hypothetical protein KDA23_00855 [Candidatus Saccharibacteria bacterium]|nr:hypothetical protein [Candidatus Saccharibacteria bacterium]